MLCRGTDNLERQSGPFVGTAKVPVIVVCRERLSLGRVVGGTTSGRIARVRVRGDGTRNLDEGFLVPVEFDDLVSWNLARDEPFFDTCR